MNPRWIESRLGRKYILPFLLTLPTSTLANLKIEQKSKVPSLYLCLLTGVTRLQFTRKTAQELSIYYKSGHQIICLPTYVCHYCFQILGSSLGFQGWHWKSLKIHEKLLL